MIKDIFDALETLRRIEKNTLPILRTYYGKAYKPQDAEGVIGYRLKKPFINAFGMYDSITHYLIHRRSFYPRWAEQCGLNSTPKTALGLTINREIYDDMLLDHNDGIFNITHENDIHRFKVKDIIDYAKHMRSFAINQNHGFREVGFPIALHYDITKAIMI